MQWLLESTSGNSPQPQYARESFELTEAAEWLAIDIQCVREHQFQFYLTDSQGAIRAQYYAMISKTRIVVGPTAALSSCGSVPGIIPQGLWSLHIVGFPAENSLSFSLKVTAGIGDCPAGTLPITGDQMWINTESDAQLHYNLYDWNREYKASLKRNLSLPKMPSWFAGDFHMHTLLSDGKRTPIELTQAAVQRGLDFIVITEHNAMTTGWPVTSLLVIPGVEITSSKGHFNAIGLSEWIDFVGNKSVPIMETEEGMNRVLDEVRQQGAISSLNHPMLIPYEWQFKETPMEKFDTIELWNDPTYPDNVEATEQAIRVWDELWANGQLLWGIGGSDLHLLAGESYVEGGKSAEVGDPTTFVWCDKLTANEIINAAKQGHSYMSRGPRLSPVLESAGRHYLPGQQILNHLSNNQENDMKQLSELTYRLQVTDAPVGSYLIWFIDGKETHIENIDINEMNYAYSLSWNLEDFHWIRLEVRDEQRALLALVNPFYCGVPISQKRLWSEFVNWKTEAVEGVVDDRANN
ncbi:hypothetical protein EHS13_00905 [Paenibacillus psychroresistens]|uniref:Polymerase/histidinol phosphatase N-terminal domain-containing protein n=1 Tax=Paenibacillus psychroresistens TaxID=1778678 RepID=A0A6B8RDP2_9BACL|nr:CehA/McbA family metallohydrolase [Paenibacillus psychroresistens]QGQ93578.1 hypothetical protein EHS13_00905 [Paenibacillus psychroresistens]